MLFSSVAVMVVLVVLQVAAPAATAVAGYVVLVK
jgi:hypothetical protein